MIDQLFGVEMGSVVNDLRKSDYSEDWELAEEITVKQSTSSQLQKVTFKHKWLIPRRWQLLLYGARDGSVSPATDHTVRVYSSIHLRAAQFSTCKSQVSQAVSQAALQAVLQAVSQAVTHKYSVHPPSI